MHILCPVFVVFMLSCISSLYSLVLNPYQVYCWQIYSPFSRQPFHCVDSFLCYALVFQFDVVPFVYFCLVPFPEETYPKKYY